MGRVHFSRVFWTFLVMKCFIDSVVQEATFYFIIIVMMPEGFLRQKKKCGVTFLFITMIRSLFVSVASLSGSSLSWGRGLATGLRAQSGSRPGSPWEVQLLAGRPMRRKTWAGKSTLAFSGCARGQQGQAGSRAGKMHLDLVNLLTI